MVTRYRLWVITFFLIISAQTGMSQEYDVTVLEHPNGQFFASDLNNVGAIAGWVQVSDMDFRAVVRTASGEFQALPTPDGFNSFAYALNDSNQVIGVLQKPDYSEVKGVIWKNGGYTELSLPVGSTDIYVNDINNAGQVVGSYWDDQYQSIPAMWNRNGERQDLPVLEGGNGGAMAINDEGQIVGGSSASDGLSHVVMWDAMTLALTDLGTLGNRNAVATDINQSGQVAGYFWDPGTYEAIPFIFQDGAFMELPKPDGTDAYAWALNDDSSIVGVVSSAAQRASGGSDIRRPYARRRKISISGNHTSALLGETNSGVRWGFDVDLGAFVMHYVEDLLTGGDVRKVIDAFRINKRQAVLVFDELQRYLLLTVFQNEPPILKVTIKQHDEDVYPQVGWNAFDFTVLNIGASPSFNTYLSLGEYTTPIKIGDLAPGESKIDGRMYYFDHTGEKRIGAYAYGKDLWGNDVESETSVLDVYVHEDIGRVIIKAFTLNTAEFSSALYKVSQSKAIDVYFDSVRVADDVKPFSSTGILPLEIRSTAPLVDLVDGDDADNSNPLISFHLNMVTDDSLISKENQVVLMDAPGDTIQVRHVRNARWEAADSNMVDISFIHAAAEWPELDAAVSGNGSEHALQLTFGDISDYLALSPSQLQVTVGNEVQGADKQTFQLDLQALAGQVISVAIVPDTTVHDSAAFTLIATDTSGAALPVQTVTLVSDDANPVMAPNFELQQNYPNPFNPSTMIRYSLAEAGEVLLAVYDANGRLVRTLAAGRRDAGPHSIEWNGLDETGHAVSSGVYLYRLQAGERMETRKLLLVR